ncbi:hypothetical protein M8C21_004000 [Ambrosia artemisiifolia]|uniref:Uncharacterized protein n=1 Tax=Ambrosia artemisiifolia TaxID=4212 RepID=A0AAD5BVW7_AMBAR|nr:hypothetical protein M8C21_004000 [Ambrosia artemisiifolia]
MDEDDDNVAEIKAAHFEESMKYARSHQFIRIVWYFGADDSLEKRVALAGDSGVVPVFAGYSLVELKGATNTFNGCE